MDWARQLAAVGVVFGFLSAAFWLLRRRGFAPLTVSRGARGRRRLERVERLALGPQHAVELIRLGDRALLVAAHPAGCSLIASYEWRELNTPREASE